MESNFALNMPPQKEGTDLVNSEVGEKSPALSRVEVNTSPSRRRRQSKSLLDPTASMVCAMKELELRKGEIKPEDDPFWEKRGGKGSARGPKFKDVPMRSARPIKETLEHMQPLDPSSHLLAPTKAATEGTYHKPEPKKELKVTPLPPTSHLLTPTKASEAAHFTPPPTTAERHPKPSPRTSSPVQRRDSSRLLDLTKACQASVWTQQAKHEADPREHGWDEFFARKSQRQRRHSAGHVQALQSIRTQSAPSPERSTPPGQPAKATTGSKTRNKSYKDVPSKLHNPTVASVRQMWVEKGAIQGNRDREEVGGGGRQVTTEERNLRVHGTVECMQQARTDNDDGTGTQIYSLNALPCSELSTVRTAAIVGPDRTDCTDSTDITGGVEGDRPGRETQVDSQGACNGVNESHVMTADSTIEDVQLDLLEEGGVEERPSVTDGSPPELSRDAPSQKGQGQGESEDPDDPDSSVAFDDKAATIIMDEMLQQVTTNGYHVDAALE